MSGHPILTNDPITLPLLPLRDVVVFPHMVIPLFVGRPKSIKALEAAMESGRQIMLVAQKAAGKDEPKPDDMFEIGCVSSILQMLKLPDGTVKVLVEGIQRANTLSIIDNGEHFVGEVAPVPPASDATPEIEALRRAVTQQFDQYVKLNKKIPPEILTSIAGIDDPGRLADTIAAHLPLKLEAKQSVLDLFSTPKRLEKLLELLEHEVDILQVEKRIRGRVKRQMEKSQREYYLNEQVKAIQKELGDGEDGADLEELEKKIVGAKMSKEARKKAESELKKLKLMSPMSAEATVVRNFIDTLVNLPWAKKTKIKHDLANAEVVLNEDHFGLDKVKDRILEYLAVQQRVDKVKAPILCLVGPPGVGKTSLGQSVARATGRKFVRMALGGMRDEAEIRGHRRTYIGSMPEVLDPEQNHTFSDHYVEVDFDLSDVMFVATSNSMNIPPALLDRMEVIRLAGYTEDEKLNIAQRYLLPKQQKNNGVKEGEMEIAETALRAILRYYTREAGVRSLEREIGKICRKVVKGIALKKYEGKVTVTDENLNDFLGVRKYDFGRAEKKNQIGQVVGLAWTEVGGDLLTIEAAVMPGKGVITRTGSLGDVMKESVEAARTVVRSRARRLGLKDEIFEKRDIHIHVPDGATPKDGPSAGAAMTTALVSALCGIPVRADVAMTGEITLRGEVTAIGGLKEKLLAAHRGGVKTVLIPEENVKDLQDIPENAKNNLEIVPVKWIDQVLAVALEWVPQALPDDEPVVVAKDASPKPEVVAPVSTGDALPH
jgi:ATP-dependent Lon protease